MIVARIFEIVLGLVFLVGAALKAVDIPGFALGIRQYQIFFDPQMLQALAIVTVIAETLLGAALLAGIRMRGVVHGAAIALLVFFSAMIGYAWAAHGLEDCACFGSAVKMGPGWSIVKNVVMVAMLLFASARSRREHAALPWSATRAGARIAAVAIAGVIVAGAAAVGTMQSASHDVDPPAVADTGGAVAHPAPVGAYAGMQVSGDGQTHDLGKGTYLVAIMSATCDHCKDSVEVLNALAAEPGVPQIIGIMMGKDDELEEFRGQTMPLFPTQIVDTMLWLELLGDAKAPPRFVLVRDGAPVEHWDDEVPPAEAIASANSETPAAEAMS